MKLDQIDKPRPLAIVTGGRRGIGAGIAMELGNQGFDVAITDLEERGSEEVIQSVKNFGGKATYFQSDLADVDSHELVVQKITDWGGPIACLVNNAGIPAQARGDMLDVSRAAYDIVMNVNVRGTFFFTQAVTKHMLGTATAFKRSVITVSSVSAEMASIERAEYCLSKSSLAMLTKLYALRLAPFGIGVFEIRPGIIKTPMTGPVIAKYDKRIADGLVPCMRWGFPEDVALAVASIAKGELGFSTGSVLNVDGGLSIPAL